MIPEGKCSLNLSILFKGNYKVYNSNRTLFLALVFSLWKHKIFDQSSKIDQNTLME